jgi:hypothetical protein
MTREGHLEDAWKRRDVVELDGVPAGVIAREDLIRNKKRWVACETWRTPKNWSGRERGDRRRCRRELPPRLCLK